jgi:hypothetical protein
MRLIEKNGLKLLYADDENNVITDIESETLRAEQIYLGIGDSIDNYKEINKNTPVPIPDVKNDIFNDSDRISEKQLQTIKEVLSDD